MTEIRCPKCGEVFQVDETSYNQIAQQVRDKEFEKELERRSKELDDKRKKDLEVIRLQEEKEHTARIAKKDAEISTQNQKISELQAKLDADEAERELAVTKAVAQKSEELSQRSAEIVDLKAELKNKENEILLQKQSLQDKYEDQLKSKNELIKYYQDFKAHQSTKMIGESLEQHCLAQFNTIRASAFPRAYFEKDNDDKGGSKGDFIYREYGDDDTEYISIMFEMKNEADETTNKRKNKEFFKKLDKDRREKGCEYAILVSLLEMDNELYNQGIVNVSYEYQKMYVIRPQFFISIIMLLRDAARNSLQYKKELREIQEQQIDISHFEENMNTFKQGFARNYRLASEQFSEAIKQIEESIKHLEKTKDNLVRSQNNLRLANDKADDLSIKSLTKGAPSVKAMFDNLGQAE